MKVCIERLAKEFGFEERVCKTMKLASGDWPSRSILRGRV